MQGDFTIRVATAEDAIIVAALLQASYPLLMAGSYDKATIAVALPLMTQANPFLLSLGSYYLAFAEDDYLVGSGGWSRQRPGSGEVAPGLAHIRHFATHPAWTGRGIGRTLYTRLRAGGP